MTLGKDRLHQADMAKVKMKVAATHGQKRIAQKMQNLPIAGNAWAAEKLSADLIKFFFFERARGFGSQDTACIRQAHCTLAV